MPSWRPARKIHSSRRNQRSLPITNGISTAATAMYAPNTAAASCSLNRARRSTSGAGASTVAWSPPSPPAPRSVRPVARSPGDGPSRSMSVGVSIASADTVVAARGGPAPAPRLLHEGDGDVAPVRAALAGGDLRLLDRRVLVPERVGDLARLHVDAVATCRDREGLLQLAQVVEGARLGRLDEVRRGDEVGHRHLRAAHGDVVGLRLHRVAGLGGHERLERVGVTPLLAVDV